MPPTHSVAARPASGPPCATVEPDTLGVMLVARVGLSPRMVGRQDLLARLSSVAAGDEMRVALISGEAGIGKTRLVQELLSLLPEQTPVLAGQAEQGAALPYGLLLEAVAPLVDGWDD